MRRTFIETTHFRRRVDRAGKALLARIQEELLESSARGRVIQGAGGIRKARIGDGGRGKGKRGGWRVIYLDLPEAEKTYLLALYGKGEKTDISSDEKRILRDLASQLKREAKR